MHRKFLGRGISPARHSQPEQDKHLSKLQISDTGSALVTTMRVVLLRLARCKAGGPA